ncbi:MAG: hypothetical protein JST82_08440 [Bacteroidetes bacterium]|nr:hypothetical protein [Bacteroidota bacterium]
MAKVLKYSLGVLCFLLAALHLHAQNTKVGARIDAAQIMVGDQARLFIEAKHNTAEGQLQWATIPDTFNKLEIVERSKIDTIKNGSEVTYKQRLLITGFDSGLFLVPSFAFSVLPASGTPYTVQTDSFPILVQTVAVDTTKGFIDIKGIRQVKGSWLDYLVYIIGGIIFLILVVAVVWYFAKNKKAAMPAIVPQAPKETPQEKALRLLSALEQKKLWENNQPKEYLTELVDILRYYIEERFSVDVMECTSDEILYKAAVHKEMSAHRLLLSNILSIADLAKFAKAQPTPQEHLSAMEYARQFVAATKPIIVEEPTQTQSPQS